MIEINWKQDYKREFLCPSCEKAHLWLGGFVYGKQRFICSACKTRTSASIELNRRSRYLDSRIKDEYIDWKKDYHGEFICPECETEGMTIREICQRTNKRYFYCSRCRKAQRESSSINKIVKVEDPLNQGVYWYTNHRIKGFVCPECQQENMYLVKANGRIKKSFKCRSCEKFQSDSIVLNHRNLSRFSNNSRLVKSFDWMNNEWDLRAIKLDFNERDSSYFIANFTDFEQAWFKDEVKRYVYYLCKGSNTLSTITSHISSLRFFSRYLVKENILRFSQINRNLMLDFLSREDKVNKQKLGALRDFFVIGTIKKWFEIEQDIIRDADYPKKHRGNPDPISKRVTKQIEENLHVLPDPIARMWLICYFTAMRPNELALVKRDCLVQEGQYWKLVWYRKKVKDQHEVPISRTVAQIVQEQQKYIQNLWGDEWNYLFCHYHNLSSTDPSQPKLEPVKKVLPTHQRNPLLVGIRTLITALKIKDENGKPATFQTKLLRSTRLTELFEQGHDLAVVSAWAGHKELATTSTYYTQVSCELMEREAGHIQKALVNSNGHRVLYESYPKSFWENPTAHKLELDGTHINTPIYGMCGLPLDQDCQKFRACYTCNSFVATIEKLPQYINTRDELRTKQARAMSAGHEVLVEQFGTQADRLDNIIASLQQEAA
jgi:integrase/transposase-like protein